MHVPASPDLAAQLTMEAAGPTRFCTRCHRELPIDEFHRTRRSGRARQVWCKRCFNDYLRLYRRGRRSARLRRYLGLLAGEEDVAKIRHLAARMFKHFGGVNGLTAWWIRELDAAEARGDSAFAAKTMLGMLNLAVFCETFHEQEAELGSLSEAERDEARDALLRDLITTEPALVLRAAARLGWTVSPPATDAHTG